MVGLWIIIFIIISVMDLKGMVKGFLLDLATQNPRMVGQEK